MRLRHLLVVAALAAASTLSAGTAAAHEATWYTTLGARPTSGTTPLDITFSASEGTLTAPYSYTYDFGDGTAPLVTTSDTVEHVYAEPGQYDPSLTATTAAGPSAPAHVADSKIWVGSGYNPVNPVRILDTRAAIGVPGKAPLSGTTVILPVTGIGQVPATRVTSVVLNVTVTGGTRAGYLAVEPYNFGNGSSSVNWAAGQTLAGQVTVPVHDGKIMITDISLGSVHVIADLEGYFSDAHGYFNSVQESQRILDTRARIGVPTTTAVPAHGTVTVTVPPTAAQHPAAVILNVTATGSTAPGVLTAYPAGQPRPAVSHLNWAAGQTVANLMTLAAPDRKITFYNNSSGPVHLIADYNGYFSPDVTSSFRYGGAQRILDTRNATGTASTGPIPAKGDINLRFDFADSMGGRTSNGVLLHITITQPTASGVLVPYDGYWGDSLLKASLLNWTKGQTISNTVAVANTNGGNVRLHLNSSGSAHVVVDVIGYYDLFIPQQID
ncbi:PKD domain-containing protein [Actinacidiphila paucisporea]|uniref:Serine protease n=1 Tax=Actinacidiphila paucisporea TaxID=310782 RepID=A0A1M7HW86_9ACTN|nr:PKD domain-containing protein [Actinacidiphila paucisporea]SHM32593.1 serine protease [Actinacidiphila paucisporea]